jgi:hypothetical protein
MKNKKKIILIIIFFLTIYPLSSARGIVSFYETNSDFNPNYLVPDNFLTDYKSLTIEQIRDFIESKGGTLNSFIDPEVKLPA